MSLSSALGRARDRTRHRALPESSVEPGPAAVGPAALLALIAALSGCGDNPICVFGGNCQDSGGGNGPGGGIGIAPATTPDTGNWISPDPPEVEQMRPVGASASSTTPIVLRFNESLNPDTLAGAFEIVDVTFGLPTPFLDPPALVGDGRVVVIDPLADLMAGAVYVVQFTETQGLTDLTGQLVQPPGDGVIGDFGVIGDDPEVPVVVATYPPDGVANQSDLTEIVVVFDRIMDVTTFNTDSWSVLVDGAPPLLNPPPVPYFIDGPTQIPVPNIFRWASIDPLFQRVSLGPGGMVELTLSPAGNELTDPDDNVLPETQVVFDLAPIGVPSAAFKISAPLDAFGRDELMGTDTVLQVDLPAEALAGDVLRMYVFGTGLDLGAGLEAVSRTIEIDATTMQVDVTGEDMDLIGDGGGVFLSGPIDIALSHERGNVRTPVRLADADPVERNAQSFYYDVIPPELLGLGGTGTVTMFFESDVRDLVIVGRANEELRSVRVGTDTGINNYTDPDDKPPVALSDTNGLFVAAPVPLGVVDSTVAPPLYTVEIFDRALNSAMDTFSGRFDQLGAVGPGGDPTGAAMQVTVFDAFSLERLESALVMTHQDDGGAITFVDSVSTSITGFADPNGAAVGETIVTVDLAGYDLFTFHGAPQAVLHVPLVPTGLAPAMTGGQVTSPSDVDLTDDTTQVGDTRRSVSDTRLFAAGPCVEDPITGGFGCPFGPDDILPERIGLQTALTADLGIVQAAFDADDFMLAFALRGPASPVDSGDAESVDDLTIEAFLADLGPEERAIGTDPEIFSVFSAPTLGTVDGAPAVTIEGITPGVDGSSVVGLGLAYDPLMTEENWDVLGAYPGSVDGIDDGAGDELGSLIVQGTFEADLFLRAVLADVDGNRVGVRSRFSNLDGLLEPPDVPTFLVPGPGGMSRGPSYDVVVADGLPDGLGADGLYRVVLTDSTGRSWTLWRPDPPGVGNVTVNVPDIGAVGGDPLAAGPVTCIVSEFAWENLDPDLFMWSDVEREQELLGHTASATFTQN